MKKRVVGILVFFLILINLSLAYSQTNDGISICNINRDCGVSDGICPNDYFPPDETCYIEDPDCCTIKKDLSGNNNVYWSTDSGGNDRVTRVNEGQSIYMYVETSNCNNKDANFDIYGIRKRTLLPDQEVLIQQSFATKVISNNKAYAKITPQLGSDPDISTFKFKVRINPTGESNLLDIDPAGSNVNSCNDAQDNDGDGCSDESLDCANGNEDAQDSTQCSEYSSSCAGWKCTMGECINGFKSIDCPEVPNGCGLVKPLSNQVKCYEKSVPFPFFSNFNAAIVILFLAAFYGFRIYRKK